MTNVPAARFEDTANERGSQVILRSVGAFVEAYGVHSGDREQIANTLAAVLAVASGYASPHDGDARIAVIADVMPGDVQVVLRLCSGAPSLADGGAEPTGGFELWVSFPRE
jgi:hypothetical protein